MKSDKKAKRTALSSASAETAAIVRIEKVMATLVIDEQERVLSLFVKLPERDAVEVTVEPNPKE